MLWTKEQKEGFLAQSDYHRIYAKGCLSVKCICAYVQRISNHFMPYSSIQETIMKRVALTHR